MLTWRLAFSPKQHLGGYGIEDLLMLGWAHSRSLLKNDLVRGLKDVKFEKDKLCCVCQAGKQVVNTHPTKAFMSTTRVLELLHMDLFGPTTYKSLGENLYCLVIVEWGGINTYSTRPRDVSFPFVQLRNTLESAKESKRLVSWLRFENPRLRPSLVQEE